MSGNTADRRPTRDARFSEPDAGRPFGMLRLLWHVALRGHSVHINRHITVPLGDSARGWLYVCECGGVVAQ